MLSLANSDKELLVLVILIFIVFIKCLPKILNEFRRPKNFPPGPSWLIPFVGNSRYLRKLVQKFGGQHKAFEFLAKKYKSPIISLKLGRKLVVIATTYPIVKKVYIREELQGRPDNFFIRLRTMGTRLGITCTDQEFWNEQRTFVVRHLKSIGYGRSIMEERIDDEIFEVLQILRNTNQQPIYPGTNNLLSTNIINILWTFTTGYRIKRGDERLLKFFELLEVRSKAFDMTGGTLGQMPWLRFIAPNWSGYNLIKDLNSKFFQFFMEIIDEHMNTYSEDKSNDDLIYAYIKEMEQQKDQTSSTFSIKQLLMIILDIFMGGAQTTSIAIDLVLMAMIIFPEVQKKCQEELDRVVAVDGKLPNYSERHKTPYFEAVLLEVSRWFCFVPVGAPRRVLEDCKLEGYDIPKDTTLFTAVETALNDETIWKEPQTFDPERFLDENMNIINADKVIIFGTGRRKCLGDQLANECVYKFVAAILDEFTLHKSNKKEDLPKVDLEPGILMSSKPYKIIFKIK